MSNPTYEYLVLGANGQDGIFMTRYLLKKNYSVVAVVRKKVKYLENLKKKFKNKLKIIIIKNYQKKNFIKIFKNKIIRNVYFFAGFSKIPQGIKEEKLCYEANFKIFKNFLEFIVLIKQPAKILYINSSEIFGSVQKRKKNENSKLKSSNFYGECKILTYKLIDLYVKKYSLFISNIIAYNHESCLSPNTHIISKFIRKFRNSKSKKIKVFNPNEYRNVSHVYDFIPMFEKVLKLKKPSNYVFANDENYKIIDIVHLINKLFYDNKFRILEENKNEYSISRKANNDKIKKIFKYKPKYNLKNILLRLNSYDRKNFKLI